MGGKLTLRAADGLYDVAWPVPGDPPQGVVVDASNEDTRCEGLAVGSTIHVARIEGPAVPVVVDLGKDTFSAVDRVIHDSASGKLCSAAYVMESHDRDAYVYPDKGGWTGWSHRTGEGNKTIVEPFTCH
jgi:hypothetical protein